MRKNYSNKLIFNGSNTSCVSITNDAKKEKKKEKKTVKSKKNKTFAIAVFPLNKKHCYKRMKISDFKSLKHKLRHHPPNTLSSSTFPPLVSLGYYVMRKYTDSQIMCPKCHRTVVSEVKYSSGLLTYLFCGGLFLCGFVFGCCLIPFCVDRLKDAKHTCPTCKTVLGVYRRL
uniref:LITAF domain-containing protein n=1 Tax=Poecilia reticulata TaxID=8081 RepID=A0A3P9MS60_POERE